jgi:hypothetical protein
MLVYTNHAYATPARHVDVSNLLRRICVRPPYFALNDLRFDAGTFNATAVAERAASLEVGPMQACDISRHAAICGLSAVALGMDDDDRRFYLAQDATYQGVENSAPYGSVVSFQATVIEQNKRQATAEITVTAGGHPLAQLSVTYTIMNEGAFRRLFRSKHVPSFSGLTHDRMPDPPMGVFSTEENKTTLLLERVPMDACAGHFDQFPAMPVAVLMGQLGLVAGRKYGAPYWVEAATMSAGEFCWAGETARFEVTSLAEHGRYAGTAFASDTAVSDVTFRFAPGQLTPLTNTAQRVG